MGRLVLGVAELAGLHVVFDAGMMIQVRGLPRRSGTRTENRSGKVEETGMYVVQPLRRISPGPREFRTHHNVAVPTMSSGKDPIIKINRDDDCQVLTHQNGSKST